MLRCADSLPHGKGSWVAVSQLPPAPPAPLQPDTLLLGPTCVLQVPDSLGSGLQLRGPLCWEWWHHSVPRGPREEGAGGGGQGWGDKEQIEGPLEEGRCGDTGKR